MRESLAYDPVFGELQGQRVTRISAPATVLYDADYTRDKLGRLATQTETIGGATTTTTYGYDGNGRLVSAVETGAGVNSYAYTYDQNGNRLTGPGGVTYSYDAQDRLVSSSAGGGTTYTYTPDGKLASKTAGAQTTTYTYDALGNLRQVALPGGPTVSYRVDGEGNRIDRADGQTTRRWLYDRAGRIVAELDGANALVSLFVYATTANTPDLMLKGGTAYRIVSDQLGSVRLVADAATGAVAQRLDYDPFGRVLQDTSPGFQPFGFAGGLYDSDTGLVRFGARDYDPEIGRWTAKDPIGFSGGYTNLYSFVGSDPVNLVDPSGLGPTRGVPSWENPRLREKVEGLRQKVHKVGYHGLDRTLDLVVSPLTGPQLARMPGSEGRHAVQLRYDLLESSTWTKPPWMEHAFHPSASWFARPGIVPPPGGGNVRDPVFEPDGSGGWSRQDGYWQRFDLDADGNVWWGPTARTPPPRAWGNPNMFLSPAPSGNTKGTGATLR